MSLPTLADLKAHLRIRHDAEDADLQDKLDAAIEYAAQFIDRPIPWKDEAGAEAAVPKSVGLAIKIMAESLYAPDEKSDLRKKAENMLHFYRVGLGV